MLSHHISRHVGRGIFNSFRRDCNHVSPAAAKARALYSYYVLNRDTTSCFLDDQEINESPKYTHIPLADF